MGNFLFNSCLDLKFYSHFKFLIKIMIINRMLIMKTYCQSQLNLCVLFCNESTASSSPPQNSPNSRLFNRKGPKWLTCMMAFKPSAVLSLAAQAMAALFTNTSSLSMVLCICLENCRTDWRELRSRWCTSTRSLWVLLII